MLYLLNIRPKLSSVAPDRRAQGPDEAPRDPRWIETYLITHSEVEARWFYERSPWVERM